MSEANHDSDKVKRFVSLEQVDRLHAPGSSKAYNADVRLCEPVDYDSDGRPLYDYDIISEAMSYAFVSITDDMADYIRGEIPEVDGMPVMCIGSNFGKHYYSSDSRTVPVDVLEKLNERDMVLVDNVGGGWENWEGRPEWSDYYIDFSDATVIDMDSEIAERRE